MNTKSAENSCLVHKKDSRVPLCNVIQSSYEESNAFSLLHASLCKNRHLAGWQFKIPED